jgi:hypothetical protein
VSFKWTRAGATITSRCTLCSLVLASRLERDIHAGQRAHDAAACQQRRLDAARALYAASPEGQAAARKLHVYDLRNARHRELYAARHGAESRCDTTVLGVVPGVETDRIGDVSETAPSVTSTPPLAPRLDRSTSMKSSASKPVPPLDSRGVA